MNKSEKSDIADKGLNERLDLLARTLNSTNNTLEGIAKDLIEARECQSRLQNKYQITLLSKIIRFFKLALTISTTYHL